MGQSITVVQKPSAIPGVVRFETNRNLTGMGHERYRGPGDVVKDRIVDRLAARLFEAGGVDAVHIYGNVVTVDLSKGATGDHLADAIEDLFVHYVPGVLPPSDDELVAAAEG